MEPGYTLTGRIIRAADNSAPPYTIIVDSLGDVVWYSVLDESTEISRPNRYRTATIAQQLLNGNLLYRVDSDVIEVDLLGNEVRRVTMEDPGAELHHELFPTVNRTYLSIT